MLHIASGHERRVDYSRDARGKLYSPRGEVMRVTLQRRIAVVAAVIVPAVAVLALSASPAFAALPRCGRLVLGSPHTLSPLAVLIVALGTAAGLGLLVRLRSSSAAVVRALLARARGWGVLSRHERPRKGRAQPDRRLRTPSSARGCVLRRLRLAGAIALPMN